MNYEAIIFDIDGTLIDYDYSQYYALDKLLDIIPWNKVERPITKDVFDFWYKEKNEFYNRPDSNKINQYDQQKIILENVLANWKIIVDSTQLTNRLFDIYETSWRAYPDVLECLFNINKYKLCIISNGDSKFQRLKLTKTGLERYFSEILISGDIKIKKPNSKIYQTMSDKINIPIDKCVYIGDRLDFDAIGSSDAGMLGVWLNRKNITDKKIPKKVKMIASLQQLTPLLI
tara:strand:- start:1412 stop:2104 length:693 start_codon:yes stop_codon:yes gene_type:complete